MRGIWGRRDGEELLEVKCNEFGQSEDEMGTKMSNFNYDKRWKTWYSKFKLDESSKTWTIQKFGKKLRDWRNQLKKKVHEEHFEYLIGYWSTDHAQEISRRNQVSRSRRIHNHTTGTKTEQFKHCFTKKDGTQTVAVKTAIDKMQKIDNENPDASSKVLSRNDSYAQVMGLDKNGRVGMCGPEHDEMIGNCPCMVILVSIVR
ncbi:hypothetical protein ACJIZ3_023838 [Penstemon smallii]|uniref:Uncharacterized protein n=1 Tax=Penstemon smallii TaxID=265156 RepID=A0ABD3TR58_9LAMI